MHSTRHNGHCKNRKESEIFKQHREVPYLFYYQDNVHVIETHVNTTRYSRPCIDCTPNSSTHPLHPVCNKSNAVSTRAHGSTNMENIMFQTLHIVKHTHVIINNFLGILHVSRIKPTKYITLHIKKKQYNINILINYS